MKTALLRKITVVATALLTGGAAQAGRDIPVPKGQPFASSWALAGFEHDLWTRVLADHVDDNGLVDYAALRHDSRFSEYLYRLANTNPAEVGPAPARRAFWMNAYNALVVQGVLATLPADRKSPAGYSVLKVTVEGITEPGKGFFRGLRFVVGGRRYTLDEIEHAVLLQRPEWVKENTSFYRSIGAGAPDPRIHFALVCAARGCPELLREAFDPLRVDAQLDENIRRFMQDASRVRIEGKARRIQISQLTDWYGADFVDKRFAHSAESLQAFLSRYVGNAELSRSLSSGKWAVSYIEYDWGLNSQRK